MRHGLKEKLFKKYPRIFGEENSKLSAHCISLSIGDGWYNLIDELLAQIQHHLDWTNGEGEFEFNKKYQKPGFESIQQVEAAQIKEKFGGLRFYYIGGDDHIDGMIRLAEGLSFRTCEECGSPGTQNEGPWIRTFCDPCKQDVARIKAERWLAIEGNQRVEGGFAEPGKEVVCDLCGDISAEVESGVCIDCKEKDVY